jgi:hypothetical protein
MTTARAGRAAGGGDKVPVALLGDEVHELPSIVKATPQCSCPSAASPSGARNVSFEDRGGISAAPAIIGATCVSSPCSTHRKCRTVISCEIDSSWAKVAAAITATVNALAAIEAL